MESFEPKVNVPAQRLVLAKDQPQYKPLPVVAPMGVPSRPVICAFEFSDLERRQIATGANIYIEQLCFENPYHPIKPTVVPHNDTLDCMEHYG